MRVVKEMKIYKTLTRIYVHDMKTALSFYEKLFQKKQSSFFSYPEMKLELAQVGDFLLLAGKEKDLEPFKKTVCTFLVDSVDEWREYLLNNGSKIIRDKKKVPTGFNITFQHPDGTWVEYVEHR